jgi:DNA polymerase-3 subunit delta'
VFRSIVGHRRLIALLSRAIAHDRLPPALLLAGPAGVGKRRTAVAVARALNCLSPVSPARDAGAAPGDVHIERDACGVCAACRRIERGVHPDVLVLEPDDMGSIKIEPVRDAIDRAGYRPFEGRRRVVIIDEADALRDEAQNALLKTLEEPPPASIFILVSSRPDGLLATVRSRCPRLRFGQLAPADVAAALVRDHGYTEADAHAAAADTDGSIGRALADATTDRVDARAAARRLLEQAMRVADPARRIDTVKDLTAARSTPAEERHRLSVCLRAMASLLRDLGLMGAGADERLLANADVRAELAALARHFDSRRSTRAYAAVDEALAALERNVGAKMVADWLVLQL